MNHWDQRFLDALKRVSVREWGGAGMSQIDVARFNDNYFKIQTWVKYVVTKDGEVFAFRRNPQSFVQIRNERVISIFRIKLWPEILL